MTVRWICRECGTINMAEKEEPSMKCYVCAHERDSEELLPIREVSGLSAPGAAEPPAVSSAAASGSALQKLKERFLVWWKGLFGGEGTRPEKAASGETGSSAPGGERPGGSTGDIVGWEIEISHPGSREASLTARPVRDALRRREDAPSSGPSVPPSSAPSVPPVPDPDETPETFTGSREEIFSDPGPGPEDTPWPEHRIRFRMDAIRSRGFVSVRRTEMAGTKGYTLMSASGGERFMPLSNMKIMGFAEEL